jgi:hypothetical protein
MAYFTDIHQIRRINRFNLVDVYAMGGSRTGSFAPLKVTAPAESREWARRFLTSAEQPSLEWIAVQAGASDVMKAWRPQHFGVTLARFSSNWTGGVLFIGSASEQGTIAQVIQVYREAGGRNVIKNAAGQTTLAQLAALLAQCRLLLTNDTGPMHLAVGVQTPVIDLSVGHVDFQETGPYGPGHWVLQPDLDCAPCGFEQVCPHQACKDRVPAEAVADLMRHVLGQGPCPPAARGYRLYRSTVDEDQLGAFQLTAGREDPATAWYAAFWRRYWYERFTGRCSKLPAPMGPPPDAEAASAHVEALLPLLDELCRRADRILRAAGSRPVPAQTMRSLQSEQARDRERAVQAGMSAWATKPLTAAVLRQLYQDNVQGLERMACHHADAYRRWYQETLTLARCLFAVRAPNPLRMMSGSRQTVIG